MILIVMPVSIRLIKTFIGTMDSTNTAQIGFIAITFYGFSNSLLTLLFVAPFRIHLYNTFIYPVLYILCPRHMAPRRRSMVTYFSSTHQNRRLTLVKSNIFVSDTQ